MCCWMYSTQQSLESTFCFNNIVQQWTKSFLACIKIHAPTMSNQLSQLHAYDSVVYLNLTSHPSIGNLWIRRVRTSSLQISSTSCETWSKFGSDSPSPESIVLIVTKFFSTSSKAYNKVKQASITSNQCRVTASKRKA